MQHSEVKELSELIYDKIYNQKEELREFYNTTKSKIGYFFIDDLLPESLAKKCHEVFPDKASMRRLKSMREYKYISAQMNKHDQFLEHVIYAFQDEKIVSLIGDICGYFVSICRRFLICRWYFFNG